MEDEETKRYVRFVVMVECDDNSINEFENLDFLEDELKDFGRIIAITIRLSSYMQQNLIRISLDSIRGYGNIIIEGKDRDWVDAKYSQLIHAINLVKAQENWYTKNRNLIFNLVYISLGILPWFFITSFLDLVVTPDENPSEKVEAFRNFNDEYPWIIYVVNFITWWLLGTVWARLLMSWVSKLWPSIEFDFGHEHLNLVKERRKRLKIAGTVVVMPIVLAIVRAILNKYI